MRTCILSSFFFLSCAALAQGTVVTGEFKQEYRTLHLYNNIQKALFILEKGNVYLPENRAYFLKLSPSDAKRLETSHILLSRGPISISYGKNQKRKAYLSSRD